MTESAITTVTAITTDPLVIENLVKIGNLLTTIAVIGIILIIPVLRGLVKECFKL